MTQLVLVTYDWVPEPPRGLVRDLRVRWALEEAGLPYRVESTPFEDRPAEHIAHQPFAQVPWLTDGDVSVFESGAVLLYLAEKSEALMPKGARPEATEWVFAALNSVEMATQPWVLFHFWGVDSGPAREQFDNFVKLRLDRMEPVLAEREWLVAGQFGVADILMADVLRVVDKFDGLKAHPACKAYVDRATARPAFQKAHADQLAHFAAADAARA
ncbi:glutathione S-transferase family protein [Phenylobacterium sp.]|uniref:glutathione S-transferase family protein n=1 Tax=Phenylobacterium sp. TaxID=1871053 RepID=UPI0025F027CA|nr:glutathione S-transferase family protein [Phenylobacterium sp.]MBX3482688.1 glutathione S-transferase family protein [Phenylobacterium sp.]MCW5760481.1 glutathione S-transferase family protein [Phenylobacterium sp.]